MRSHNLSLILPSHMYEGVMENEVQTHSREDIVVLVESYQIVSDTLMMHSPTSNLQL